jgi:L-alanine-DL-glutamate epimerase-like enolase superfamily enzyme
LTDDLRARPGENDVVRIRSIEVRALAPDVERFRYTAFEPEVYTTTTLVRVTGEDGTTGYGAYDSDSHGTWDRAPIETLRPLVPRLIGLDTDAVDAAEAVLTDDGTSPFPPAVRSAVDIAMWDARAKARSVPLRVALGGERAVDVLPSYASVALHDDEPAYLDGVAALVADGFRAVKLHAWGEPSRDAALIAAVRARFPSLVLMHDAEGRYDRDGAALVARACADAGVRWFEAPLPDFDLDGYRALRRRVPGVPVLAAGDALWDPRLVADVVRDPPWDAMRFDASFVGGITAARRLMAVANDAGLDVELISYGHTAIQAANLHLALAYGRTTYFEQPVPPEPWEHAVLNPIRTGPDGTVRCPRGPGLGIELDEAALDRATIARVMAGSAAHA